MGTLETHASLTNVYDLLAQTSELFRGNCPVWRKFKFSPSFTNPTTDPSISSAAVIYITNKSTPCSQTFTSKVKIYVYGMVQRQRKGPFCPHDWGTTKRYSGSCDHKWGTINCMPLFFYITFTYLLICVWVCVYVWMREKERECVWEHVCGDQWTTYMSHFSPLPCGFWGYQTWITVLGSWCLYLPSHLPGPRCL